MDLNEFRVSRIGYLIFLLLASCTPAIAQGGSGLGGSFNDPAGEIVTRTIVDRVARRRLKNPRAAMPASNDAVQFRSTGTQLKTREIANIIDAGNAQVFTIMSTILTEYEKGARAAGHPNDLALALSFFFATNASIYHNAGEPADPALMELRDAITEALVESKALNGVTDRKKQEMYETLVIFTGFALATYQEGKQGGNAETVKVSQQLAGQNLLAITGISPDKISFSAQGLSIDNSAAAANDSGNTSNSSTIGRDPFPDRPGYAPQKPLSGSLKDSITMDDLVGRWDHGAGSVKTYVDSNTGNYAGTATSFYGEQLVIKSNGTFEYKFVGRANNSTVRETDRGTIILSGGYVTAKFEGRMTKKYQFIAFNIQPTGAAILSLVEVHDDFQGYDAAGLAQECGHGDGFIHCVGGEEWARLGNRPAEPAGIIQSSPNVAPAAKLSNADFLDFDPFPDKPYIQPQKPLIGRLRKTITTDDLAGTWEIGGAAVTTYVSSGTGTYTDASFFGKKYFIRADGTYDSKFQGRASNTTIRESDSGTVVLSGGFITMKSRQNPAMRYQFVAFMSQPNGAAVLSLIYIGNNAPLDGEALRANCGHANGYVSCLNGEEWVRIP